MLRSLFNSKLILKTGAILATFALAIIGLANPNPNLAFAAPESYTLNYDSGEVPPGAELNPSSIDPTEGIDYDTETSITSYAENHRGIFLTPGYKVAYWAKDIETTLDQCVDDATVNGCFIINGDVKVTGLTDFPNLPDDGAQVTLYAVWAPLTYKVIYNPNPAQYDENASAIDDTGKGYPTDGDEVTYGEEYTFSTNGDSEASDNFQIQDQANTKIDAVIEFWSNAQAYVAGSSSSYALGQTASNLATPTIQTDGTIVANSDQITVYAQWDTTAKKAAIILNPNPPASASSTIEGFQAPEFPEAKADTSIEIPDTAIALTGYTFEGWGNSAEEPSTTYNKDDDTNNKFPAIDTAGTVVTYYAVWKANEYNVIYNVDSDVKGCLAPTRETFDTPFNLKTAAGSEDKCPQGTETDEGISKLGYTLGSWVFRGFDEPIKYTPGGEYVNLSSDGLTPVILNAAWDENEYSLVFKAADGGECSATTDTNEYLYTADFTLSGKGENQTCPADHNHQVAWSTVVAGDSRSEDNTFALGAEVSASELIASIDPVAEPSEAKIVLYAVDEINQFGVTYDANYEGGPEPYFNGKYDIPYSTEDVSLSTPAQLNTAQGTDGWNQVHRTLKYWSKNKTTDAENCAKTGVNEGTCFLINPEATPESKASADKIEAPNGQSTTLYAVWENDSYKITYDGNGGEHDGSEDQLTDSNPYDYFGTVNLPDGNTDEDYGWVKDGSTATAWATCKDSQQCVEGVAYQEFAFDVPSNVKDIYDLEAEDAAGITLYAQWAAGTWHKVTFDGGGTDSYTVTKTIPPQFIEEGEATDLSANEFEATNNYVFIGWNDKSARDADGHAYLDQDSITLAASVTLYAQWARFDVVDSEQTDPNKLVAKWDFPTNYSTNFKIEYTIGETTGTTDPISNSSSSQTLGDKPEGTIITLNYKGTITEGDAQSPDSPVFDFSGKDNDNLPFAVHGEVPELTQVPTWAQTNTDNTLSLIFGVDLADQINFPVGISKNAGTPSEFTFATVSEDGTYSYGYPEDKALGDIFAGTFEGSATNTSGPDLETPGSRDLVFAATYTWAEGTLPVPGLTIPSLSDYEFLQAADPNAENTLNFKYAFGPTEGGEIKLSPDFAFGVDNVWFVESEPSPVTSKDFPTTSPSSPGIAVVPDSSENALPAYGSYALSPKQGSTVTFEPAADGAVPGIYYFDGLSQVRTATLVGPLEFEGLVIPPDPEDDGDTYQYDIVYNSGLSSADDDSTYSLYFQTEYTNPDGEVTLYETSWDYEADKTGLVTVEGLVPEVGASVSIYGNLTGKGGVADFKSFDEFTFTDKLENPYVELNAQRNATANKIYVLANVFKALPTEQAGKISGSYSILVTGSTATQSVVSNQPNLTFEFPAATAPGVYSYTIAVAGEATGYFGKAVLANSEVISYRIECPADQPENWPNCTAPAPGPEPGPVPAPEKAEVPTFTVVRNSDTAVVTLDYDFGNAKEVNVDYTLNNLAGGNGAAGKLTQLGKGTVTLGKLSAGKYILTVIGQVDGKPYSFTQTFDLSLVPAKDPSSISFPDVNTKATKVTYKGDAKPTKVAAVSAARKASIQWLAGFGITIGSGSDNKGNVTYRPQDAVNRGAMAQFLQKLAGFTDAQVKEAYASKTPAFKDIASLKKSNEARYYAILWLADTGITTGSGCTVGADGQISGANCKYLPSSSVNRGAMAEFMQKFAGFTPTPEATSAFPDVKTTATSVTYKGDKKATKLVKLNNNRVGAINWLASTKITVGSGTDKSGKTVYRPQALVNRGAMAQFMQKLAYLVGSTSIQAQ